MFYCGLLDFCKSRGVLNLPILIFFIIISVCYISIAWILLFFLSACESQNTPQKILNLYAATRGLDFLLINGLE